MRRFHLILLVVIAVLGAVIALAVTRSPVLGLDLQGGLEVVLEAQAPPGQEVTEEDLDRSIEIMRDRIDKLGVSEPEIRKQGSDQIVIELAGVHDQGRAAELIGKTAQLQFYDLEGDLTGPSISANGFPVAQERLYPLLKSLQSSADEGTPSAWYLYDEEKNLIAGPEPTKQAILDGLEIDGVPRGEAPEGSEFLSVPGNRIIVTCGPSAVVCPGVAESPPTKTYYYVFEYEPTAESPIPEMTGDDLKLTGTRQDFDPQTGQPVVLMQFTDQGADRFEAITRELAIRGQTQTAQQASTTPLLQHFAIVLDGEIQSWPSIDFNQYPDGISGNNGAQITGLASVQEAKDLALVLQTGALPLRFEQVDRTDISATLGEDSLREALIAGIGGLIAVAIFLLVVYRFLGVIAIIGLGIYGALLYGAILLFNVTLTLPGFAGLILTIGVAADANIVIFERIKEEVRAGRSVRAAIPTGYKKGFATILDANVVTMITAFVLFAIAIASVKGFALMLLIGTLLSMVTAVAATRALLGLLSGFRWFDNPAFMGATGSTIKPWQRIDVNSPRRRRIWLSIATGLIVISIISIAVKGLNLGIDFEGGSQISFTTPTPTSVEDVRSSASAVVPSNAVVQGRGEATGDEYTNFQIRTESLTPAEQTELQTTLERELDAQVEGIRNVSGSFSSQIARGAILAIVVSFVLISIYITFRFQWRFAVPILRTLFNDILITLGVYSLSGRELTTATIAAVLTILGYSIYDTIIIFDRVRENMPLMKRSSFAAIANQSLWETIRRSLATTFITLLPVASLFIFGGDTLKDFAFALLIGIGLGAISTIFVATPFLTVLMERTPEFKKRIGMDDEELPYEEELPVAEEPVTPAPARARSRRARKAAAATAGAAQVAVEQPPAEHDLAPEEAMEPAVEADEPAADEAPADEGPADEEPSEDEPAAVTPSSGGEQRPQDAAARREARRQRRRARPHGRAR
jgi:SecD/SecF fusion protein